jgi:hypothetical protein
MHCNICSVHSLCNSVFGSSFAKAQNAFEKYGMRFHPRYIFSRCAEIASVFIKVYDRFLERCLSSIHEIVSAKNLYSVNTA